VPAVARTGGLFRGGRDTLLGVVLGFVACALLFGARSIFHQDSWLALLAGREIWNSGIPHHDTLTALTLGRQWVDQQWLSQLTVYALYRLGGLALVSVVHITLVVGSMAAAVAIGRRRGTSTSTMLLILVVGTILVLLPSLAVRTQPYAYPLFIAVVYLLSSDSRAPSRAVFWTLPLLILWANVHGSAALGAGLVSLRGLTILFGRQERERRAEGALLTVLAPLCLLVTPYGLDAVSYYKDTLFNPQFNSLVAEWRPVTDVKPAAVAYFALTGLAVWSMGRNPGRMTLWERLALLVLFAGGILALRNVVWVELSLLMLPAIVLGSRSDEGPVRPRVNQLLAVGMAAAVLAALVIDVARSNHEFEKGYPQGVLRAVSSANDATPDLKVFADVAYADWLLWRLPELKGRVAFDARLELLHAEELKRLARALTATGIDWKVPVRGYRLVVLTPDQVKYAARGFKAEPGRRILFEDDDGLVILRSTAAAER
jgi:hypothetical protein